MSDPLSITVTELQGDTYGVIRRAKDGDPTIIRRAREEVAAVIPFPGDRRKRWQLEGNKAGTVWKFKEVVQVGGVGSVVREAVEAEYSLKAAGIDFAALYVFYGTRCPKRPGGKASAKRALVAWARKNPGTVAADAIHAWIEHAIEIYAHHADPDYTKTMENWIKGPMIANLAAASAERRQNRERWETQASELRQRIAHFKENPGGADEAGFVARIAIWEDELAELEEQLGGAG